MKTVGGLPEGVTIDMDHLLILLAENGGYALYETDSKADGARLLDAFATMGEALRVSTEKACETGLTLMLPNGSHLNGKTPAVMHFMACAIMNATPEPRSLS